MADIRISDLNLLGAAPEDSDYLLIVQSSGPLTKRVFASDLFKYVDSDYIQSKISSPVKPVDTISDLRTVTGDSIISQASVSGYSVINDGGGGLFHWDAASTDSDDSGVVIKPTSVSGAGRWVKDVRSRISVKEFGVVGNGTADDTVKLQAAMNALLNTKAHTLDFDDYVCGISNDVYLSMTKSIKFTANGGGIKVISNLADANFSNLSAPGALAFNTAGYNLEIEGLHFDGNDNTSFGLHTVNTTGFTGKVILRDCLFENIKRTVSDGQGSTSLVRIRGGYENVIVKGNRFRNVIREAGTGIFGSVGCEGVAVFQDVTTGASLYTKMFTHEENHYSNINTEDVGTARVDCDAVKFFTGETVDTAANTAYYQTHFRSTGNTYEDAAGRAMKIQASHGLINGETVIRKNVYPINSWTDINLQLGSGIVSNCEFFYEEIGGEGSGISPFHYSGGNTVAGDVISFYAGNPKTGRPHGPVSVSDCIIYNDVPDTVGTLQCLVGVSAGSGTIPGNQDVEINNLKMVGGAVDGIVNATNFTTPTITNFRINGTSAPVVYFGLVGLAGSAGDNELRVTAVGNSQYSGTIIPAAYNTATKAPAFGTFSGFDNIGYITNPSAYSTTVSDSDKSPIALRVNTIFGLQEDGASAQNGVHLNYRLLFDDSTWVVPSTGTPFGLSNRSSTVIMSVDRATGVDTASIFTISKSDWIDYLGLTGGVTSNGTTSRVVFDSANGNHDISNRLNIWHDGDNLHIKNTLGGSARINLFTVG